MSANSLLKIFLVTMSAGSLLFAGCSQQKTSELNTNPPTTNPNTVEVQQSILETKPKQERPNAPYIPSQQAIVDKMLEIAKVGKNDIVYDLGSGDGRIPITVAKKFGARSIGIEYDPELIKKANENARNAGVTDKVKFLQQDIFKSDFSDATVVTLFLEDWINIKLRPQLFKQLKPGTRVISQTHHMGDWVDYEYQDEYQDRTIYMWTIPKNVPKEINPYKKGGNPHEPIPQAIVDKMLEIAKVGKNDIVYDLGSGDGRIPITAAKKFGTRSIGIELDPELIKKANENARNAGVTDKVKFLQQDVFKSNFSDATVVTLFLEDWRGVKLRPKLFEQLKPGTRVISQRHHLGDWVDYDYQGEYQGRTIYMWTIPENVPENLRSAPNSRFPAS